MRADDLISPLRPGQPAPLPLAVPPLGLQAQEPRPASGGLPPQLVSVRGGAEEQPTRIPAPPTHR